MSLLKGSQIIKIITVMFTHSAKKLDDGLYDANGTTKH